jgi:predicted RNA polymerase sigma factor
LAIRRFEGASTSASEDRAARADMLRRLGSFEAAEDAYRRALALMANGVERAYLERRLAEL